MARSKLDAALKKTGGMKAIVDTTALQDYSTEELPGSLQEPRHA